MLNIINLSKDYYVDNKPIRVLKNLDIEFRKNEFVAIVGPSGCGKTTLLNIIGGLDRYTEGDLVIDNVTTKNYKDSDWDSYRNHRIGFVFQSYNLISHLSVLNNVELALTISGIGTKERRAKAKEILIQVGLEEHLNKRPNQLSGGQMQRVAIARALINDPNIILADEPTGALDSETSVEVMDLLKNISKDKLIIMVTHNESLAKKYSNRTVSLLDGVITNDTNPVKRGKEDNIVIEKTKKTSMSFFTALALSFKNLLTKKARTALTAFAGSIGIIGIALSLSLKNGFDIYLKKLESDNFDTVPLEVSQTAIDLTSLMNNGSDQEEVTNGVGGYDPVSSFKPNDLTSVAFQELMNNQIKKTAESVIELYSYNSRFVNNVDNELIIRYRRAQAMILDPNIYISQTYAPESFINTKLNVVAKKDSSNPYQAYIFVNQMGRVPNSVLEFLGLPTGSVIEYNDILGKTFKVYQKADFNEKDLDLLNAKYDDQVSIEVTSIVSSPSKFIAITPGIYFNESVKEYILTDEPSSEIGGYLIYPKGIENKNEIKALINAFNKEDGRIESEKITFLDSVELSVEVVGTLTDSVSVILIAFSAISLFVSSVMIGIITYTSVLERTKEIGVLRSIGSRKKDISRVFNAEGIMLGFISGTLGVALTLLINPIISNILEPLVEYEGISRLNITHAIFLIIISVVLTLIAGFIPSKIAAKKDPVVALRTE
ncbi:MAG: ATP-binding cassette domain-containing protein [Acholeplasma sp.]|nr:ATP-binding cassette domain-containing protein [Acholeplasma sp.]